MFGEHPAEQFIIGKCPKGKRPFWDKGETNEGFLERVRKCNI